MDTKRKCHYGDCDRYVYEKSPLAVFRGICDRHFQREENPPERTVSKLVEQGLIQPKKIDRKPPSPIQTYKELKDGQRKLPTVPPVSVLSRKEEKPEQKLSLQETRGYPKKRSQPFVVRARRKR